MDNKFNYTLNVREMSRKLHKTEEPVSELSARDVITRRKILIIYAGGSLAMDIGEGGQLSIDSPNSLEMKLKNFRDFYDKKETFLNGDGLAVTKKISNVRIHYNIIQYSYIKAGGDASREYTLYILNTIRQEYDKYDGFLVVSALDTLEYVASSISFLIMNLTKPVIFTGSQAPLSQVANDAYRNLLGIFRIFGNFRSEFPHS